MKISNRTSAKFTCNELFYLPKGELYLLTLELMLSVRIKVGRTYFRKSLQDMFEEVVGKWAKKAISVEFCQSSSSSWNTTSFTDFRLQLLEATLNSISLQGSKHFIVMSRAEKEGNCLIHDTAEEWQRWNKTMGFLMSNHFFLTLHR